MKLKSYKDIFKNENKIENRARIYFDDMWNVLIDLISMQEDDKDANEGEDLLFYFFLYNSLKMKNPILKSFLNDNRYKNDTKKLIRQMIKSKLKLYEIIDIQNDIIIIKDILNDVEFEVYDNKLKEKIKQDECKYYYLACHLVYIDESYFSFDSYLLDKKLDGMDDFIALYLSVKIPEFLLALSISFVSLSKFEREMITQNA